MSEKKAESLPLEANAEEATEQVAPTHAKRLIYRVSMGNFYLVAVLDIALVVGLVGTSVSMMAGRRFIEVDILFLSLIPILLALGILGILIVAFKRNYGRCVTLSPTNFTYDAGNGKPVEMGWRDFQYICNLQKPQKSLMDKAIITDGRHHVTLERFFFSDYDRMCQNIQRIRQHFQERSFSLY